MSSPLGYLERNIALPLGCETSMLLDATRTGVLHIIRKGVTRTRLRPSLHPRPFARPTPLAPTMLPSLLPPSCLLPPLMRFARAPQMSAILGESAGGMEVHSPAGQALQLSDVVLQRIDMSALKYGLCWESRFAPPQSLMAVPSDVEASVTFSYTLSQNALIGELPLGSGSGSLIVKGFLGLNINLAAMRLTTCEGHFGFISYEAGLEAVLGVGAGGASADVSKILDVLMPIISESVPSIICTGQGTGVMASTSVALDRIGEADVGHKGFRGLVDEVSTLLHEEEENFFLQGLRGAATCVTPDDCNSALSKLSG